jgi:hypothetical protein
MVTPTSASLSPLVIFLPNSTEKIDSSFASVSAGQGGTLDLNQNTCAAMQ